MLIAQIVLPDASAYERKCQRVDFAALAPKHNVVTVTSTRTVPRTDVAHVYGPSPLPREPFIGFATPYVASSAPAPRRFSLRKPVPPRAILADVPEAVEEHYFASRAKTPGAVRRIGSYARPAIVNMVEQSLARIHRFRDDVEWTLFENAPSPDDLTRVDAWVDPAVDENDLDGFVAEAVVAGQVVVASRIAINTWRLENGRTGFLVPAGDPNELTHAILAALFKPEVASSKIEAARQTAGKFRPRQRLRILERIYEDLSR